MRFTFLGTSAGVPTGERNVTGLAIAIDEQRDWYLVDCGEATQHQLLRTDYTAARLRAIFITHVHGDHCYGLPGLIASAGMGGRTAPLTICAPDGIEQFIAAVQRHTDLDRLSYPLRFLRTDLPGFRYADDNLQVTSIALSHRVPSYAFHFTEVVHDRRLDSDHLAAAGVPRGPLWGDLQHGQTVTLADGRQVTPEEVCQPQRQPRRLLVGGDNDQPELLVPHLRDSDVLIHEATFTEEVLARVGPTYQHSTPAMVARTAQAAGLRQLVLTHFSQRYRRQARPGSASLDDLAAEARRHFDGQLYLAEDLATYEIDREHQLRPLPSAHKRKRPASGPL